jgi:hypothetical protein
MRRPVTRSVMYKALAARNAAPYKIAISKAEQLAGWNRLSCSGFPKSFLRDISAPTR